MRQRFGQPAVNMCRATLSEALINRAWCENVELRFEKRLVAIEDRADRPIVAHFADGSSAEGDFVIGADGVHSAVRTHVIPDGPKPFDTGLIGFGGFVPRSVISGHADREACGDDVRAKRLLRLRLLQFRRGRRRDVVEHAAFAWRRRGGVSRHEPGCHQATLLDFHAGWHDPIPRILEAAENIVVTATLDVATLPTWSRKRTLLIGDAAHATSPHAGQGASLALEDAMRLGRLMQDKQELGLTFQNFEAERRPRAETHRRARPPQRQQQARVQRHRRLDPRPHAETAAAGHGQGNGLDVRLRSPRGVSRRVGRRPCACVGWAERASAVPTIYPRSSTRMVGTRSLSSGAHSRDPVALPTLQSETTSRHQTSGRHDRPGA